MSGELKALILSSGIHGIIILAFIATSHNIISYNMPIVIDLSILDTSGPVEDVKVENPLRPVIKKEKKVESRPVSDDVVKNMKPVRENIQEDFLRDKSLPVAQQGEVFKEEFEGDAVSERRASVGHEVNTMGNMVNSGSQTVASSRNIESSEQLRQRYLREHFSYIRDIVMKNLSYPLMARRMGWSGRVTLYFVVNEDGSVRDIKVIEGSGFEILDKNAMETIKRVSPFPRPPVSAEVIIPVVYRLN